MKGFVVVNHEVFVARRLERAGRSVFDLDFIRWRVAELTADIADDAEFWGLDRRDIARSRAEQLAAARQGGVSTDSTENSSQVPDFIVAKTAFTAVDGESAS